MKLKSGYENRKARFEIVPLMDVLLFLLIFFVYSMLSMTVQRGITVNLPGASSVETDRRDNVAVSITSDNRLYVNKKESDVSKLVSDVQEARAGRELPIVVNGDKTANFGVAVTVLDRLRQAGVPEVSFQCLEQQP